MESKKPYNSSKNKIRTLWESVNKLFAMFEQVNETLNKHSEWIDKLWRRWAPDEFGGSVGDNPMYQCALTAELVNVVRTTNSGPDEQGYYNVSGHADLKITNIGNFRISNLHNIENSLEGEGMFCISGTADGTDFSNKYGGGLEPGDSFTFPNIVVYENTNVLPDSVCSVYVTLDSTSMITNASPISRFDFGKLLQFTYRA